MPFGNVLGNASYGFHAKRPQELAVVVDRCWDSGADRKAAHLKRPGLQLVALNTSKYSIKNAMCSALSFAQGLINFDLFPHFS